MVYSLLKYRETEGIKVRRLGIDLSEARLQQELLALGFTETYSTLNQADKSLLRYIAIMKQSGNAMTDLARTLDTPANALRILQAQFELLSRSVGSVFIPVLNAVLPPLTAIVIVIREIISAFAALVGFEMPGIDYKSTDTSGFGGMASDIEDVGSAAGSAAKQMNYLIGGFDELNVMNKDSGTSGGGGGVSGGGGNLLGGIDLPEYDMFAGLIESKTQAIVDKIKQFGEAVSNFLKPIMPVVKGIAGALTTILAMNKLSSFLKFLSSLELFKAASPWIKTFTNALFATDDAIGSARFTFDKFRNSLTTTQKVMIGATGFVATFVTAYDAMNSFAQGSMTAIEAFGNIAVVTGVASAAMYALLGPIGLVIGAVGTAAGAFLGYKNGVEASARAAFEATEEYQVVQTILSDSQEIIDRSNSSIRSMQDSLESINSLDAQWSTIRTLVDDIYELSENTNKSAYETTLLQTKVEYLNSLGVPDLNLSLNETGEYVVQTKDEIYNLIAALEEQARMAALQDVLTEAYKAQYQAALDVMTAQRENAAATDLYNQEMSKLNDMNNELYNTQGLVWKGQILLSDEYQNTKVRVDEYKTAMEQSDTAYQNAMQALEDSTVTIDTTVQQLTNLKNGASDVTTAFESVPDVVSTALDFTGLNEKLQNEGYGFGTNLSSGLTNGITDTAANSAAAAAKMASDVNSSVKNVFGIHSPSTVFKSFASNVINSFANEVKAKISVAMDAAKQFASSVKKSTETELGIVEGKSGQFATYGTIVAQSIANGITAGTPTATEAMRSLLNALLRQLETFSARFADGVNSMISNYASAAASIQQSGKSVTFSSMNPVNIPRLANGGVAYESAVVEIGEYSNASNDPEIVTPQSIMKETMMEAMGEYVSQVIAAIYSANEATAQAVTDKDMSVQMDSDVIATSVNRTNRNRGYDIGLTPV